MSEATETHRQKLGPDAVIWPWDISIRLLKPDSTKSHESPVMRKMLEDHFANSLKFVNVLYTRTFGAEPRKVPAHMPHMIDVQVMQELQSRWPDLFEATSSHRYFNICLFYFYLDFEVLLICNMAFHIFTI